MDIQEKKNYHVKELRNYLFDKLKIGVRKENYGIVGALGGEDENLRGISFSKLSIQNHIEYDQEKIIGYVKEYFEEQGDVDLEQLKGNRLEFLLDEGNKFGVSFNIETSFNGNVTVMLKEIKK